MDLKVETIQEDHIHFRRVRPRIRFYSTKTSDEITSEIKSRIRSGECNCQGQVTSNFATIYPPVEEQHYWSPQLTITLEEDDSGTLVRGLYGPRPAVWTMFVFFYSIIGFATIIVAMIGLSFRTIGQPANILWAVPGLILLFFSLYLVAYFGQRFGHKQMTRIHRFMEECFGEEIEAV
ncbi:MAG: hypothetical protein JJ895_05135 [Balneolaceae bacterium]|nr:hypothetical protein [Balneolaceae bacterium]